MLVPRVRDWTADAGAREALDRIAADPAVASVHEHPKGVDVRLADDWVAGRGEALESALRTPKGTPTSRRRALRRLLSGANTTKALHVGHLRNLALGDAIAAGLRVGGARVENRSLICDVGRAGRGDGGVVASGRADDDLAAENGSGRSPTTSSASVTPSTSPRAATGPATATTAPWTRSPARRPSTKTRPTS